MRGRLRSVALVGAVSALSGVGIFAANTAAADSGGDWSCEGSVSFWTWETCPDLAPGTYSFANTSPDGNGVYVVMCGDGGADCNNPFEERSWQVYHGSPVVETLPQGWGMAISGTYAWGSEDVSYSATPASPDGRS